MGDMFVWVRVLGVAVVMTVLSSCMRDDVVLSSQESVDEFENRFQRHLGRMKDVVHLQRLTISESISNAFVKAEKRKGVMANHNVIPIYCTLREDDRQQDLTVNANRGFYIEVRSFGCRVSWNDLNQIWLIVVLPSLSEGHCDVLECSLANIVHGMGSAWSNYGFGTFWCRCNDPRLGWGSECLSWHTIVAEGSCKMYLLLDTGDSWGRRPGRTVFALSEFEKRLERLNKLGVLVELVPVAYSKKECILQCM